MLDLEYRPQREGLNFVIGVDEAGRGPLAGPVVASAVALRNTHFQSRIDDSKKITSKMREEAFHEIFANAYVGIGIMSEAVIDEKNILEATFDAMNNAIRQLISHLPKSIKDETDFEKRVCLLIDGNRFKTDLNYAYETIIRGDQRVLAIACASIVAKVTRDRILSTYDRIFPEYGFRQHKGYPTLLHKRAIQKFGPSMIHRKSFNFNFT